MAAVPTEIEHPLAQCARVIGGALDEVTEVDPVYLPPAAKASVLVDLQQVADRTRALMIRVLATAEDLAADRGARSAGAWLAHHTRRDRTQATADARLGEALEGRWHQTRGGVLRGAVNLDQAAVIVRALDALPADLTAEVLTHAEAHLVEQAASFTPHQLRILGRRVLDVIAPEIAEDHERRALEAEERRAREATRLTMRRRGDGTTDIRITTHDHVAARLKTYLEAYASPRRTHLSPDDDGPGESEGLDPARSHSDPESGHRIPYPVLLGRAFATLLEAIPTQHLPIHGGAATTVVVTMGLDQLCARVGAAELTTGDHLSPAETLRLACTADIVPLVLGGQGQPLHLGRARRLFDRSQRLAMAVRDGHCRAEGCDIPAAWCEAHHANDPWSRGGRTDIDEGALLCSWHHHRAHDPTYTTSRMSSGDFRYHRRT